MHGNPKLLLVCVKEHIKIFGCSTVKMGGGGIHKTSSTDFVNTYFFQMWRVERSGQDIMRTPGGLRTLVDS